MEANSSSEVQRSYWIFRLGVVSLINMKDENGKSVELFQEEYKDPIGGDIKYMGDAQFEDLDIIDSGPLPVNPSELLGSDKMVDLIKTVRENYDYVIIDGPPLFVSEARALASNVDGTIMVFNAERTRRGAAQRALRELREVNAHLIGTVLVGVKSMKGGYFHEVYDSYQRYQKVKPKQAQALKA